MYKFIFMYKPKASNKPEKLYENRFRRYEECQRMETILRETVGNDEDHYVLIKYI